MVIIMKIIKNFKIEDMFSAFRIFTVPFPQKEEKAKMISVLFFSVMF